MISSHATKTVGIPNRVRRSRRRGATTVEFAIVCPIFLLFIFGLFECYSAFRVHSEVVTSLARGGREASILTASNADIESSVRDSLAVFGISDPQIVVEPAVIDSQTPEIDISVTIAPGAENGLFTYRYFADDIVKSITFRRL